MTLTKFSSFFITYSLSSCLTKACLGGPNSTCADGYEGHLCSTCMDRYYRFNILCSPCGNNAWIYIVGFVIFLLISAKFILWLHKRAVNLSALSCGIDFLQILGLFRGVNILWPTSVSKTMDAASLFNWNLQLV